MSNNLSDLESAKNFAVNNLIRPVVGVGVTAFNRLGLEDLLPNFSVVCLQDMIDNQAVSQKVKIVAAFPPAKRFLPCRRNSTSCLRQQKIQRYLHSLNKPALYFYTVTHIIEQICQEQNWLQIANPKHFAKATFEDKIYFRKLLLENNLPVIPGEIVAKSDLNYSALAKKYEEKMVIQIPDLGGGKGTFFIHSEVDFKALLENIYFKKHAGSLTVAKYIGGPSPSMTGVVTKHGVITSRLIKQILAVPECVSSDKGPGAFVGHDFSVSHFSPVLREKAAVIVKMVGQVMQIKGYRGIFGIDFVVDEKEQEIYPVECNPRLLGSFPAYTMAQKINQEIPFLFFQVLEFLGSDYQIDADEISKKSATDLAGAHFHLYNLHNEPVIVDRQIKPGIYRLDNQQKLNWLRDGFDLSHLQHETEFIVTDGVPIKGAVFPPKARILRILTKRAVLEDNKMSAWALTIIKNVREGLEFRPLASSEKLNWQRLYSIFRKKFT